MKYSPPLDKGIEREVHILNENGIETFESCEGGKGHGFYEPTIRFFGGKAKGFNAYAIAIENGLTVSDLRRVYQVEDGELVGPFWEITFCTRKSCRQIKFSARRT
jgi:hypothetical protein